MNEFIYCFTHTRTMVLVLYGISEIDEQSLLFFILSRIATCYQKPALPRMMLYLNFNFFIQMISFK